MAEHRTIVFASSSRRAFYCCCSCGEEFPLRPRRLLAEADEKLHRETHGAEVKG